MRSAINISWFFMGMITNALLNKFSWWAFLSIPIWLVIGNWLERLYNYKPKQRKIKDFEGGYK